MNAHPVGLRMATIIIYVIYISGLGMIALSGCTADVQSDGPSITSNDDTTDVAGVAADAEGATDAATTKGTTGADCKNKYNYESGVCDKTSQRCVECNFAADCSIENSRCIKQKCQPLTPCASDKACIALDAVCDKEKGVCVDCMGDVDCPQEQWTVHRSNCARWASAALSQRRARGD